MVLQRARLHALLDARLPGAVWLHGPTGAGKTLLLRSYLQRDRHPIVWLTADERHRDPAALFAALTAVAAPHATRLPSFSPEHRDEPAAFARGYFGRLEQALPDECAVVIDDAHHLVGATAALLVHAIDAFEGRRWFCLASQLMPEPSFAPQLAGSRLWIVGHRQLAFDRAEARELAACLGNDRLPHEALVDATDGWAAGLMLAMQVGGSGGSDDGADGRSGDPLETVRTPLALLIAGQVLGGVAPSDVARLRVMAELPQVPMDLADVAPDWASACARLQGLAERGLFVERLAADRRPSASETGSLNVTRMPKGCWRLHDLFRNALREPGFVAEPDEVLGNVLVAHLLTLERLDLAWLLAARLGASSLMTVVASHGDVALRDAHLLTMLQLAEPHASRATPSIAVWYARGSIGNDTAAALRACDEAFAGFTAEGDEQGAALSIALALFVVFATIANVGAMPVWVERFEGRGAMDSSNVHNGAGQALRIAGEVVYDFLVGRRRTEGRSQEELQDRLMDFVTSEALSANETILAGSLLVAAMCRAIRLQDVEVAIVRVEGLASFARSAPHIRASWAIENAFHFAKVGAAGRARSYFDGVIVVADENALLQPRIAALIGLARLELSLGDQRRAQDHLEALEALGQARLGRQRGWVVHLWARVEVLSGRHDLALERIEQARQLILEAGFPQTTMVILDQDRIQILYASGSVRASLDLADRVIAACSAADRRRIEVMRGLLEAHSLLDEDRPRALDLLGSHLPVARSLNLVAFIVNLPVIAAQVAAAGLRAAIEVDFLIQSIRVRRLPAPRDAPANWPWPVRVEVLRSFRIVLAGEPLASSGKAQQKPLELLKYLACSREHVADSSTLAGALWPDAEEVAARKTLEVTVARLRKLLNDESLVIVKEGKVALDHRRVTSDAREFLEATIDSEAVLAGKHSRHRVIELGERLLGTFRELPLEHDESSAWREGVRERYRTSFVRAVRALINYWEQAGDVSQALALIEAALAREPLAENLYRLLMRLHMERGEHTEAMRVYRQCRQMLSVLIGTQPAPETERLKGLIQL